MVVKVEEIKDTLLDYRRTLNPYTKKEVVEVEQGEEDTSVDIKICNITSTFSVGCNLDLHRIGKFGSNVEYKKEQGKVNMRFRRPPATAIIRSSGKIMIFCSVSEENAARKSARQCARALQKIDSTVRFLNFKVVNVQGTCSMPFSIRICDFVEEHPSTASYEPELHPDVTFQLYQPKATLKIFSTGSIIVTGVRAVGKISEAIKSVYPLVKAHSINEMPEEAYSQETQINLLILSPLPKVVPNALFQL